MGREIHLVCFYEHFFFNEKKKDRKYESTSISSTGSKDKSCIGKQFQLLVSMYTWVLTYSVGPCEGELSQQVRDQNSIPRGQKQHLEGGLTHRGFPHCHGEMVSDGKSQPSKR